MFLRPARLAPFALALIIVLISTSLHHTTTAYAATFIVDDNGDSGNGSLREAITLANATTAADIIEFRISGTGVHLINLNTPLPDITRPVTITAETEEGWAAATASTAANIRVELNGNGAGAGSVGLKFGSNADGSVVRGLAINRFTTGIQVLADDVVIAGNHIGTDAAGTTDRGNTGNNILINAVPRTQIGGLTPADRNVISGSGGNGIVISGGATFTSIQGNYIGTTANGSAPLGNDLSGVVIAIGSTETTDNTVGGDVAGARNVISANGGPAVTLQENARRNTVAGNYLGLNAAGTAALNRTGQTRSNQTGVLVTSTSNFKNFIGLAGEFGRNVISGNEYGIFASNGTMNIYNNFIGLNAAGTADVGNTLDGINLVEGGTFIGSATAGLGNVISGNGGDGMELGNNTSTVYGNLIGLNAAGTALIGNDGYGINGMGGFLGGTSAGQPNTIAGNGLAGFITGGASTRVLRNLVYSNGGLGIDLGSDGVRPNDPNSNQNYPVITAATRAGGTITASGTLNSAANINGIIIEFYLNTTCDASGHGEGEVYVGTTTVTTNGSGNATFTNIALTGGGTRRFLTAVAVQPTGTTHSEYSACYTLPAVPAGTLNGSISLSGRGTPPNALWAIPIALRITPSGGGAAVVDTTVTTSQSGGFTVPDLAAGTYTVRVKHAQTLSCEANATISDGLATALELGTLRFGDSNGDDVVNITDFSLLAASFGLLSSAPGYNGLADFNGDNVVNISDFSLLASSFGVAGPSCISS